MTDQQPIDDSQISRIINNVMRELSDPTFSTPSPAKAIKPITSHPSAGDGLFPDPDSAVAAAYSAYEQLGDMPLELRKQMVAAMRATAREHAEVLAQFAVEETGMGRFEDKVQKNLLTANKTPGPEFLESA